MRKLTAQDIANYFLSLPNEEVGDSISNLKLQKLCYYAQGFHLAITGKPLFDDDIEAWQHGPVIPSLYRAYKKFGSSGIPQVEKLNLDLYPAKTAELLNEIYKVYGQFSAWKLREITHDEPPWKEAFEKGATTISHKALKEYFSTLVVDK